MLHSPGIDPKSCLHEPTFLKFRMHTVCVHVQVICWGLTSCAIQVPPCIGASTDSTCMTASLPRKASATSCEGRVIDPSWKWAAQEAAHGSDYPGGQQQIPLSVVIVVLGRGRQTRVFVSLTYGVKRCSRTLDVKVIIVYPWIPLDQRAAIIPVLTLYYAKQRCLNLFESSGQIWKHGCTWWDILMESWMIYDDSWWVVWILMDFLLRMSPWTFLESVFPQLPRNHKKSMRFVQAKILRTRRYRTVAVALFSDVRPAVVRWSGRKCPGISLH